jgi:2,5-furandicarboxylate decarboxylase 1
MDIVQEQSVEPLADPAMDRFRLRSLVERLAEAGEVRVIDEPVELGDVAGIMEGSRQAVWLRQVGPERAELVGGINASRDRVAAAFDVAPADLLHEVLRRLHDNTPEIVEVPSSAAPVHQVVLTGADADLTKLPVHLQHGLDGAPYISASMDFVVDAATGLTNSGLRRLMLRGPREAGIDLVAPSDLQAIYRASVAQGKPLPIAFAVGSHPIDHVAANLRLPVDEAGLISSLRGAPLPVVKCVTNDIRVPADAEWILEGYLGPRGYTDTEGPYGEFLGYYGAVKINPVFHLTAVTRRRDALFQTLTIGGRGMAHTDATVLGSLRTEATLWQALETAVREPVAINATMPFNVRIALRQRMPGEARNAIYAAFGSLTDVKNVFVVDPDIDIFNDAQMDWALATRFQADRDLVVASGARTIPLDPSLTDGVRVGAKAGFDLTWPFGAGGRQESSVPEPPRYEGARFESVLAAIDDGPKYFEELVAAIGSRDGREVVRELDRLRHEGRLDRDKTGRYLLAQPGVREP